MKIALLGDIATFGRYCAFENENLIDKFASVRDFLSNFDLVIGNLEVPFATDERPISGKSATIRAHPDNAAFLKTLGITHVTLANNHIGDFGRSAYERTKARLDEEGIGWFGTEGKEIHINRHGEKIALLGYCSYNTNPSPVTIGSKESLNHLKALEVRDALKANSANGFLCILAVHSGDEHVHMPSSDDVAFARSLSQTANYVYYGHHPHVVQGHETIGGSAIFYSLGNFIFDDVYTLRDTKNPLIRQSQANKTGVIATVEISQGRIVDAQVIATFLADDRMLLGDQAPDFDMQRLNDLLAEAGTDEYSIRRSSYLRKYIDSRRDMRNLKWYLRRLNSNSLKIILKSIKNNNLYKKHYLSKIDFMDFTQ